MDEKTYTFSVCAACGEPTTEICQGDSGWWHDKTAPIAREFVPKARLAEVERERDRWKQAARSRLEGRVLVELEDERALADELAEALKAAKSAIFSNGPWSVTLGKVIGDALAHHRERRERD